MKYLLNHSLKPYNSFGMEARARYFAAFDNLHSLQELLYDQSLPRSNTPLVLGGGSNLLLTKDVDGLVLRNELKGIELIQEDAEHYYVKAMAGEVWHTLVCYCIEQGYAGMENLSLIPGNVGASPMQNIGAYGVEIKDIFHSLEAWHIRDKCLQVFGLDDCRFGYRESVFKQALKGQYIITSVTYRLRKVPVYQTSYGAIEQELVRMGIHELSIKAIADAVIRIRKSKLPDPAIIGNAGSFFKNPVIPKAQYDLLKSRYPGIPGYTAHDNQIKTAAGWLIEQCGWKGYRKGDAGCHAQQALVLVNYGQASGQEILDLSNAIIASVHKKFDIILEREVNIL